MNDLNLADFGKEDYVTNECLDFNQNESNPHGIIFIFSHDDKLYRAMIIVDYNGTGRDVCVGVNTKYGMNSEFPAFDKWYNRRVLKEINAVQIDLLRKRNVEYSYCPLIRK